MAYTDLEQTAARAIPDQHGLHRLEEAAAAVRIFDFVVGNCRLNHRE